MHILINALSVTNQSGGQLLAGHVGMLSRQLKQKHRFTILFHSSGESLKASIQGVDWYRCPEMTRHWIGRACWEFAELSSVCRSLRADCMFSPAGIAYHGLNIPQVVLCQNPWALVSAVHDGPADRAKAMLQRHAYRRAVKVADTMVFNSEFMQHAYEQNAACRPHRSALVYQGISEGFFEAARQTPYERDPNLIVSVSAWGRHKGLETVIQALARLRERRPGEARLVVVGAWPSSSYRAAIEKLIHQLDIQDAITIRGHIPVAELNRLYATARAFCLMSHCESFGFPAIEAQAFGTPTVCADSTAMPEIQGAGGLFPRAGDPDATADALMQLLDDDERWTSLSEAARSNAQKYRWELCSHGLVGVFEEIAKGRPHA